MLPHTIPLLVGKAGSLSERAQRRPVSWSTPTPGVTAGWEHSLSKGPGFIQRAQPHAAAVRARQPHPFQRRDPSLRRRKLAQYTAIYYGETLMPAGL
jgi:hypothetical protein